MPAPSVFIGTEVARTTVGTQAVTGVGFQPVAVIFYLGAGDDTFNSQAILSIGYTDGTTSFFNAFRDPDNVSTTTVVHNCEDGYVMGSHQSTGAIPTYFSLARVSSLDADGFTLEWEEAQAFGNFSYVAIGGAGISAKVDHFIYLATAGATTTVTGLTFRPTGVMFLPTRDLDGSQNGLAAITGSAAMELGWTDGTRQGAISVWANDAVGTSDTVSLQRTDRCGMCYGTSAPATIQYDFSLNALTADGFVLNNTAIPAANKWVSFLALGGCDTYVGTVTQPSSTGAQSVTTTDFTPNTVFFASSQLTAGAGTTDGLRFMFGAGNGSTEKSMWMGDSDAVAATVTARRSREIKSIFMAAEHATHGSSTVLAEADLTSFSAGSFALDWTTVDATAREVLFFALGTAAPVGGALVQQARLVQRDRSRRYVHSGRGGRW